MKTKNVINYIRYILTIVLIYCIYQETGIATTFFVATYSLIHEFEGYQIKELQNLIKKERN